MKLGEDISQKEIDTIIKLCQEQATLRNERCVLKPFVEKIWYPSDNLLGFSSLESLQPLSKERQRIKRFRHYTLVGYLSKSTDNYRLVLIKNDNLTKYLENINKHA